MIKAYTGSYIKFDDENAKISGDYLIIEIITKAPALKQLIAMNKNHLVLATRVDSITEIKGYHRFIPLTNTLTPFGIGGLTPLKTNFKKGMLEGLAEQTGMNYSHVATEFGRGVLEAENDYTSFLV